MGLSQYDEGYPYLTSWTLDESSGTFPQESTSNDVGPSRLDSIYLTSDAAADHDVKVELYAGSSYPLGVHTIPAGAGMSPTVPVYDLLAAVRAMGIADVVLPAKAFFRLTAVVALDSGETITFLGMGGTL